MRRAAALGQIDEAVAALEQRSFIKTVLHGSASTGAGLEQLEAKLLACMGVGPQYFPEDMVTDQPERIICAELIREKALLLLQGRSAARRRASRWKKWSGARTGT